MSFGENLRTLIEERDMTQKEVALKLNIAPSTIGSYVQNTREPDFATLKAIAKFFNVSIDYLLDNHTGKSASHKEDDLLRIFRSLEPGQQDICLEQCRVFVHATHKEKATTQKSS